MNSFGLAHARGPSGGPTCLVTAPPLVRTGPFARPAATPLTAPFTGAPLRGTPPHGSFHGCTHRLTPRSPNQLSPLIATPPRATPRPPARPTPPPPPSHTPAPVDARPSLPHPPVPPPFPQFPPSPPPRPPADLSHQPPHTPTPFCSPPAPSTPPFPSLVSHASTLPLVSHASSLPLVSHVSTWPVIRAAPSPPHSSHPPPRPTMRHPTPTMRPPDKSAVPVRRAYD